MSDMGPRRQLKSTQCPLIVATQNPNGVFPLSQIEHRRARYRFARLLPALRGDIRFPAHGARYPQTTGLIATRGKIRSRAAAMMLSRVDFVFGRA